MQEHVSKAQRSPSSEPQIGSQHHAVTFDAMEDDLVLVCRTARLTRPAYRFYRALLLRFPALGGPPEITDLESLAQQYSVPYEETMILLETLDLAQRVRATGAIRAAYPFSGVPTTHRVRLTPDSNPGAISDVAVFAMCAIDALGIPLMLRCNAQISSRDPLTHDPVSITVDASPAGGWALRWDPLSAVVYARPEGHEHEHDCGAEAAGTCCGLTQFFTDAAHAATWAANHPDIDGRIYSQEEALAYSATLFSGALHRIVDETTA